MLFWFENSSIEANNSYEWYEWYDIIWYDYLLLEFAVKKDECSNQEYSSKLQRRLKYSCGLKSTV